ncbi:MFS transporter [Kribbella sp. CA-253562]|uniref:MFS transporter n=1 Tax=Kribbella sp. CA-253562 TaxID=3239942 RepID=UPI003D8BDB72
MESLWRNRDYNLWWSATALSAIGSQISGIAFPLLILYSTASATAAGAVAACQSVGFLVAAVPAGLLTDRMSRRRLLVLSTFTQASVAAAVAGLAFVGHVEVRLVAALSLVDGVALALHNAAAGPVVSRLVAPAQLGQATARMQARDSAAGLAGPPLGGLLFMTAAWLPFAADGLSYLLVVLSVILMRRSLGPDRLHGEAAPSIRRQLSEGRRFVQGSAFVRFLLFWTCLTDACIVGLLLLFIAMGKGRGDDPTTVGLASSLASALGLIGATFATRIARCLSGERVVRATSWILAFCAAGIAVAQTAWQAGIFLGIVYLCAAPTNVVLETHLVKATPPEVLGRVLMMLMTFQRALLWVSPLAAGALYDRVGGTAAALMFAAALAGLAVMTTRAQALRMLPKL